MKKLTIEQLIELGMAIEFIQLAQTHMAAAGLSTSPTFYKLTAARTTLERREKTWGSKVQKPPSSGGRFKT